MKKILMCVILCTTLVSTFAITTFADYLGVPIEDKYDFGQSMYIDTIYSDDAWGPGTEGYISSDLRPFLSTGTSEGFVNDPLTMQRFDGNTDTIKDFFLNANYTRVVDHSENDVALIVSSKHPVTSNNLRKLTYKNTKGFIADLNFNYNNMSSIMLEIGSDYESSFNALTPSVTARYVDKFGFEKSVTATVDFENIGVQDNKFYINMSVLPDAIKSHLRENAQIYSSNGRNLCHIKSIDYNVLWQPYGDHQPINDIQVHRYAYFVKTNAPDVFDEGDVLLIDSRRYESIVYGSGLAEGREEQNILEWCLNGASSFFNAKILGDITLGSVLVVFTALMTFKAFLKMFAGG